MTQVIIVVIVAVIIIMYKKKRKVDNENITDDFSPQIDISKKTNNDKQINNYDYSIKNGIFKKYNVGDLTGSKIDQAITNYDRSIYYIYKGRLTTNSEFALLIGSSEEWINIITLTKAKVETYEYYGFNTKDSRWSYGSKVIGAKEFRELVKKNLPEIKMLISSLAPERTKKITEQKIQLITEKKEDKLYKKEQQKEEEELKKAQKYFKKNINEDFKTIYFEYNQNKSKLNGALKEADDHYFKVNIINQTCSCPEYYSDNSSYEINDIRRLCTHLLRIVTQRELLKKNKNLLDQFIIENLRPGLLGIYKNKIENDLEFAILVYSSTKDIYVATPKTNGAGFIMSKWSLENNAWIPNRGGKK